MVHQDGGDKETKDNNGTMTETNDDDDTHTQHNNG
jgi:hypothetical protein